MKTGIFITGGAGLLALNWAATLRANFDVSIGIHNRIVNLKNTKSLILNMESQSSIEQIFDVLKPSLVVHTAGLTSIEACEADPKAAKHVNVYLAKNVAIICAKLNIPLIHISTDHLFNGSESIVDENFPTNPVNVYGKTKAEAEKNVLDSNPQALVIRTNFFGWGTVYRTSFSDMVINSLRAGKEVTLFQDIYFTPLLIESLVYAVHELVDKKANGIFNVTGDDRISKYDFGIKLAKNFNLNLDLIHAGSQSDFRTIARRPFDMSLSNKKTSNFLGRKIGGLDQDILRLQKQEKEGLLKELQAL